MKELRELTASTEEDYFSLFKRKVTSILIRDSDGNELRDVTKLDDEFIDNIDVVMAGFLGTVLAMHVRERRSLGGLSVHRSSTTLEAQTTKKS